MYESESELVKALLAEFRASQLPELIRVQDDRIFDRLARKEWFYKPLPEGDALYIQTLKAKTVEIVRGKRATDIWKMLCEWADNA